MFDKTIQVSGVTMTLRPYTEKRLKELNQINEEISAWIDANPDATIADVPLEKKAMWWRRKADVLWAPERPLDIEFFKSEEFEASQLKESEAFFMKGRLYL